MDEAQGGIECVSHVIGAGGVAGKLYQIALFEETGDQIVVRCGAVPAI